MVSFVQGTFVLQECVEVPVKMIWYVWLNNKKIYTRKLIFMGNRTLTIKIQNKNYKKSEKIIRKATTITSTMDRNNEIRMVLVDWNITDSEHIDQAQKTLNKSRILPYDGQHVIVGQKMSIEQYFVYNFQRAYTFCRDVSCSILPSQLVELANKRLHKVIMSGG